MSIFLNYNMLKALHDYFQMLLNDYLITWLKTRATHQKPKAENTCMIKRRKGQAQQYEKALIMKKDSLCAKKSVKKNR